MRDLGSNKREKDVRFEEKRRVVLMKTTCRFVENNVSFCWKQRVVCGAMSERKKWREESAKGGKKKGGEMEESVTLVTAKNQHRCWKAHTRARMTREWGERLHLLGEGAQGNLSPGLSSLQVCFHYVLLTLESKMRGVQRK